ncbi:MAG: DUF1648 domain-containing protein [Clostridium chrysemydis]|uniref:DUF1648 domain-containing protein n=1 Tax=Clostridium chrysemydis TaxID=2665504 RepID=UPI003F36D018
MKDEFIFITFLNIPLVIFFIYLALNTERFKCSGIYYGVRVPNKYKDDKEIVSITEKYKKKIIFEIIITFLAISIISYFLSYIIVFVIGILIVPIVFTIQYKNANREILKVKKDKGWNNEFKGKIYVDLNVKGTEDDVKINNKPFIIALIIAIIPLIITLFIYKSLPSTLAMQFDFSGNPSRVISTHTLGGFLELIMIPILNIFIVFIFYITTLYDFKKRKTQSLNGGTYNQIKFKDKITGEALNKLNGISAVLTAIFLFFINIYLLKLIPQDKNTFLILMGCTGVFVLIIILVSIKAMNDTTKSSKGDLNEKEYYRDDDEYYKLGMFYYNPLDPSILKEKRYGIGYDLNYGNIISKIIIGVCILCLLGSIILTGINYM